jgi:protocatechuate 3,4-dioxygenase beta subunit
MRLLLFLVAACLLVPATSHAATCTPTPNDGFGPFGRGMPPVRAKTGTGHVLTGVVISALDCKPIAGARVEFWQSNKKGIYVKALSATVFTSRAGRFRYESPRPTSYQGLPAHIHLRVVARGHEVLLSRYVPNGARRGNVRLVLVPARL